MNLLLFKGTISRARETEGYNVCTLYADGCKVARCKGGGYDMAGTCLGDFIAAYFKDRLLRLRPRDGPKKLFYGLAFIDPNFDAGKARVKSAPCFGTDSDVGKTVAELEKEGKSLGLERFQAFYSDTSAFPTRRHRIPSIDGGCGIDAVKDIMRAIKLEMVRVDPKGLLFQLVDKRRIRRVIYRHKP